MVPQGAESSEKHMNYVQQLSHSPKEQLYITNTAMH
jgi:hypothetical protein